MESAERGQVTDSAADVYEAFFVPALFAAWSGPVADAAGIRPGQRVLDVACGTGVLARAALERVGENGSVTGLDVNPGMLAVARARAAEIDWRQGRAEDLPFDDDAFDAVVSQFGLMFFEDRAAALAEMARVLSPGGTIAVAVWDTLENTPGYRAMSALLLRLFGPETARSLEAPYALGDRDELQGLFTRAGLPGSEIRTLPGRARFASIEAWVHTDIRGWTLADAIDDEQYRSLLSEAQRDLAPFADETGAVAFDAPAHIAVWRKERMPGG